MIRYTQISSLVTNFMNVGVLLCLNIFGYFACNPVFASEALRPRGVSLAMAAFYDPSQSFTCFDGSGTLPFRYVNDDYCDCKDGSDEPGTAACLTGIFHCNNAGHVGRDISSAFVNDGVCDCCDTSDEYLSDADCLDVCLSLGEAAREEAKRLAEVQLEGYSRRQKMAEDGTKIKKEKQIRIAELSKEKDVAEAEQAEKSAAKEAAEEPEKIALEQYRSKEEEIKAKQDSERKKKDENEAREAFAHLDTDGDGLITLEEIQSTDTFDTNRDGTVSEDEASFYLQQKESVDLDTFLTSGWPLIRPTYKHQKTLFTPPSTTEVPPEDTPSSHEEQITETEGQEEDEASDKEYDGDVDAQEEDLEEETEDYSDELEDVELTKEKDESENEEEAEKIHYDPETQRLIDLANVAREDFKRADERLRDLTREIQSLQEGLENDFGPNEEFRPFEGQCYQYTDREYTYELCPFNKATQKPKDGHGDTRLGSWGQWSGPAGNPYSIMKYTGGQVCWNGPQRSAEVKLSCGIDNELTSVTEPSRCEYQFLFTTPAVCSQPEDSGSTMHQHTEL